MARVGEDAGDDDSTAAKGGPSSATPSVETGKENDRPRDELVAMRERTNLNQEELEREKRIAEEARQRRLRSNQARERLAAEQRRSRGWEKPDNQPANEQSEITPAMAAEILGLAAGATDEEVRAAYGRLIKRVHPDTGGSVFFAKQLNIARDTLLNARLMVTPTRSPRARRSARRQASKARMIIIGLVVLFLVALVCSAVMMLLS
jgi:hypothetical protein